MKPRLVAVALAAASFLTVSAIQSANAVTVTIGLSDGFAAPVVVDSGVDTQVTADGIFNGFQYGVTASGNPPQLGTRVLNSTSLDTRVTQSTTGTLDVYVTVSGITSAVGLKDWISSFTVLESTAPTLQLSTYVAAADGVPFTLGTLIGSFGPLGPSGLLTEQDITALFSAGAVEVTALYHIVTTAIGQSANAAIGVNVVPGPLVGAGIPGLVLACGALIALARRRRRAAA